MTNRIPWTVTKISPQLGQLVDTETETSLSGISRVYNLNRINCEPIHKARMNMKNVDNTAET